MSAQLVSVIVLFCAAAAHADGVIERYDIDLELFPEKGSLEAAVTITIRAPKDGLEELTFTLNKGFEISSLTSDVGVGYEFRKEEPPPFLYADKSAPLVISFERALSPGREVKLNLEYEGVILEHSWGVNIVNTSWVEIGSYCAWYPVEQSLNPFNYDLTLKIDPAYRVGGAGVITESEGLWRLRVDVPTFDIVVFASPGLKTISLKEGDVEIRLHYSQLDDNAAEQLTEDLKRLFTDLKEWFGESRGNQLTFVLTERERGGGYARPLLVVTGYSGDPKDYPDFIKYSAHATAHLWWTGAPTDSWEDWLNEAFAEYSSLMIVQKWYGSERYKELIGKYREESRNSQPIWGIARMDDGAFASLYLKGSVLLHELREKIGDDQFMEFLRALLNEKIKSTVNFLAKLEELTSEQVKDAFKESLRR